MTFSRYFSACVFGLASLVSRVEAQAVDGSSWKKVAAPSDLDAAREGVTRYLTSRLLITHDVPTLNVCTGNSSLSPLFTAGFVQELKKAGLAKGIEFVCTNKAPRLSFDAIVVEAGVATVSARLNFTKNKCLAQDEYAEFTASKPWLLRSIRFQHLAGTEC